MVSGVSSVVTVQLEENIYFDEPKKLNNLFIILHKIAHYYGSSGRTARDTFSHLRVDIFVFNQSPLLLKRLGINLNYVIQPFQSNAS